jgi:hypothetical protein
MIAKLRLVSLLILAGLHPETSTAQGAASSAAAARAPGAADVVSVHCEVWSVRDSELAAKIEARSDQDPADAEAIRKLVIPGVGCQRLARVLVPMKGGQQLQYGMRYERPNVSVQTTARGTSQTSFSSYSQATTEFKLLCAIEGDVITTQISIQMEAFESSEVASMPPPKTSVHLSCSSSAPPGVLRVFQFASKDHETLLVFAKATNT